MPDTTHGPLRRNRRFGAIVAIVTLAMTMQILGANPAAPQSPELTAYRATSAVDMDPKAGAWRRAPNVEIPLTAQQAQWPFGGSVPMLDARALHRDGMLYIRLEWHDSTLDDGVAGLRSFVDAAAVEFPAAAATSVPSLCMGQADNGVNIWQWRAGAEEGLPHDITDLSSSGYVDRYPSTDELYYSARAAGNIVSERHAVQDLVATGFGRLEAAVDQEVRGAATWSGQKWSVVFARELTNAAEEKITLDAGVSTDVAFAIWDGNEEERDGIKSISAFVSLDVVGQNAPKPPRSDMALILIFLGTLGATLVIGAGAAVLTNRMGRPAP